MKLIANYLIIVSLAAIVCCQSNETTPERDSIYIGPCTWALSRKCPDKDVKFYLFTPENPDERQLIHVEDTWEQSNLSASFYNPMYPVKIIIHGYNSDMELTPLIDMKQEYLMRGSYNLFYADWGVLGPAPCYPAAVHNTRHVGECVAQLVQRIRDTGNKDIHLIGFSLGAHVTNYASTTLKPDYLVPRISGLDPAMPLFITADLDNKLDASDAEFVDVIHTNALVQGKIERCGHVDFYLNGGVYQPGCNAASIFQCSHHRAPEYFGESIRSTVGFWGWECQSYIYYLFGWCKPVIDLQALAGEDCRSTSTGMYFMSTNAASPFALGRITESVFLKSSLGVPYEPVRNVDPFMKEIDTFGKLAGNFNNQPSNKGHHDDYADFNNLGSDEIAQNYVNRLRTNSKRFTFKSRS